MKEELDSQLSAMFDDELPEAECQLLARRLSRDEALKERWRHYAVIGAAVRAERGVRLETNLAMRVGAAISTEPALPGTAVAAARGHRSGSFRWWQPLAGGAIAAGVAAMSVLWIRAQGPVGANTLVAQNPTPAPAVLMGQNPQPNGDAAATPESYVVPTPTNLEPRTFMPTAELANYVVAHSEFSPPMSRRNLLSALVASESGTAGASNESDNAGESPAENSTENSDSAENPSENAKKAK